MIEIIPAIDIIGGQCVRLAQGDFARKKIYHNDPLEAAREFENAGLKRLHIVDLDGAKTGRIQNLRVLEKIAAETNLVMDFGGGIKTEADVGAVFAAGAQMASVGSVAVKETEKFFGWLDKFGGDKFLLGADVKDEKIAINGWQTATDLEILSFLESCVERGVKRVFVTDISKDGLLQGAAIKLYEKILARLPHLHLIASGGVSSAKDIAELDAIGCSGVIVGKAFYEGRIKILDGRAIDAI